MTIQYVDEKGLTVCQEVTQLFVSIDSPDSVVELTVEGHELVIGGNGLEVTEEEDGQVRLCAAY